LELRWSVASGFEQSMPERETALSANFTVAAIPTSGAITPGAERYFRIHGKSDRRLCVYPIPATVPVL
jgi:hypothetical protein